MALMTWSDKFSVNIKEIDEQHKKWVQMLNSLHDAMKVGKGRELVGETLAGLVDYTKVHFAAEEKLLRRYNYPFYEGHKRIHDDMVKEVELLRSKYDSGNTMVLSLEVMQFLKNWLSEHILSTDKNYGPYLNSKGVV
ncbi:MAG: bacteriohemerythrin [Candidatus Kryptoniota bacterium]